MHFYWVKTNRFIKKFFSRYVWDIPNSGKTVYLTFDDGPTPKVTEWVLDVLNEHQIKATFFCIGNNISNNPAIFKRILNEGHSVGNHTYNHLKGWNTEDNTYLENFDLCQNVMAENNAPDLKLFRPPYGRIKSAQATEILKLGYKIIMWDILTVDYDKKVTPEKCIENATKKTTSGSIIIFHDSIKAFGNLEKALPETIRILKGKGYRFAALT
ncbi:polysaccharide deacetylase family protein [Flavobacterium pallidum]|uniref:Polysaccharide deacetylase family protein n=2 Tax=Flavobacterium pallidum TaxID=2172098 RepID=A0A2S1SLF5_9FLAO|nr:polysaccharide deacetylase family protein [Flavobacterium pallidum]